MEARILQVERDAIGRLRAICPRDAVQDFVKRLPGFACRHRDGPDEFLAKFSGKLMADCWSGFQKIELRTAARIARGA